MINITFDDFKSQVGKIWPDANNRGRFGATTVEGYQFYSWKYGGLGSITYHEKDQLWMVSFNRGVVGIGGTIQEADENEDQQFINNEKKIID